MMLFEHAQKSIATKWQKSSKAFEIIKAHARRLRDNTQGQVALTFGLVAVPMLVAGGMAVDVARHGFHEQRLAASVDAAALAIARMEDGATETEMLDLARSYIDMNYTPRLDLNGNEITLSLEVGERTVTLTADVDVPTTITTLVGVHDMRARVSSEVTKEILGTEIALVLDNTGSMQWSGKIQALQSAAETLVDVMFDSTTSTNKLKVSVVPFSAAVNVGTDYAAENWLDTTGASDVAKLNFNDASWHNWRAWQELTNRSWNGCVEARAMPHDVLDTLPSTGSPDTLFAPYFAPDEPDRNDDGVDDNYGYNYKNDYIDDGVDEDEDDLDLRQRRVDKYVNASVSSSSKGPDYNCGIAPLTPLTNDEQDLRDAIDDMVATGYTNITQGIVWGWHVLSPTAPFEEGEEYDNAAWRKFMVVMTDGDNDWGDYTSHNGTRYTGYGHIAQDRLNETNNNNADDVLDARTAQVCTNVKNATGNPSTAITVYTITFGNPGTSTREMMEDCASDESKYFHAPNSAALTAVFETIADEIGSLRLSK